MEDLTMEVLATPTDSNSFDDNNYSFNDLYILHYALVLIIIAFLFKNATRKMYINLIGGRKGE